MRSGSEQECSGNDGSKEAPVPLSAATYFGWRALLGIATATAIIVGQVWPQGALYGEAGIGLSAGPTVLINDVFHPQGSAVYLLWLLSILLILFFMVGLIGLLSGALLGSLVLTLWPRVVVRPLRLAAWSLGLLAGLLTAGLGTARWLTTQPDVEGPESTNPAHFFLPVILAILAIGYRRLYQKMQRSPAPSF